jgi:hypothetical protein
MFCTYIPKAVVYDPLMIWQQKVGAAQGTIPRALLHNLGQTGHMEHVTTVSANEMDCKLGATDLTMLEIGNAKERDLEEWKALFAQADPRFTFKGLKQPEGSRLAILETVWDA